jgi:ubiquinone/menaquinone biosynthesis C-methylase UbiE
MKDLTSDTQQMYDTHNFGTFSYGEQRDQYETLLFEMLSRRPPNGMVYDVGCGSGYWMDSYVRHGVPKDRIVGIDLAPSNVAALKAKGFHAIQSNVLDLDQIPDGSADLTVSIGVIHCTHDPERGFRELVRITKPGGHIYLNLYTKHPYYYIVHRAMFPVRYAYWHWSKRVADVAYHLSRPIFQPLAYLALGRFLDQRTGRTMFMDQVITPYAHLYTKGTIRSYASRAGCTVDEMRYNRHHLMLAADIAVP